MDNQAVTIEAVIPFIQNYPDRRSIEHTMKALYHLQSQTNTISFDLANPSEPLSITFSSDPNTHKEFGRLWNPPPSLTEWNRQFVILSTVVNVDISPQARKYKQYHGDRETGKVVILPVDAFLDDVKELFEQRIRDLLMCMTLASPGSVRTEVGAVFFDGKFRGELAGFYSEIVSAVLDAIEVGWPPIKSLPIERVWRWFQKVDGINLGIGRGSVGRAIAALSYVIGQNHMRDANLDLVWALLGLEAIYGRDSTGVKSQLLEKSQVLLGPIKRNKKVFGRIYDHRSRVIHGDVDLPLSYSHFDADVQFQSFHNDTFSAGLFAQAVLLSSLQWLIEHELTAVDFTYHLKPEHTESEPPQEIKS